MSNFSSANINYGRSTLNPIDSESQTNDSYLMEGNWDTETDHMLSYFLADGDGLNLSRSSVPQADFASTATASPLSSMAATADDRHHVAGCNSWHIPPPTPAVQFYSRTPVTNNHSPARMSAGIHRNVHSQNIGSPSQQHPLAIATSQSSSSSSLSSMAAALVSGVGSGMRYQSHQQMHLQRVAAGGNTPIMPSPPTAGYEGESPLSPAAMIGSEHENLMLPPPTLSAGWVMFGGTKNSSCNDELMGPPEPRPSTKLSWQGDVKHDDSSQPSNYMMGHVYQQPIHSSQGMAVSANVAPHQHQQFMYTSAALQAASLQQGRGAASEEESEEKRAKRLERNRESARKCRRRKKERLTSLGTQVNQLHGKIESERSRLIKSMVPSMQKCRSKDIAAFQLDSNAAFADQLTAIIRGSSPSSELMRSVLDFQYSTLKQLTLPHHQKMLLWLTLRQEKFFSVGKEQYIARLQQSLPDNAITRPAIGKISSKQVGDEMMNGPNKKDDKSSKRRKDDDDDDPNANTTSSAFDAVRTWPLFCFELKFSVDQEERFLAAHKELLEGQASGRNDLAQKRSQMAVAVSTTESLGKAVGSLSHVISKREERSILGILTCQQASAFQIWLSKDSNRGRTRCQLVDDGRDSPQSMDATSESDSLNGNSKEVSLQDISRRLSEVLRISSPQT